MTKFGNNLVGSDRLPAKFARHDPHPEIPFTEEAPQPWPYLWEAIIWTALMCLGVWGLVEGWR